MEDVLEKALNSLPPVPPAAAAAYHACGASLVASVDRALAERPDRAHLIGTNPLTVPFDNHANHWRFMSTVFLLNNWPLLARVLPWVYRAYTARGFSFDYFAFVLENFTGSVGETLSPQDAEPIVAVYRRVLELHETIVQEAREERSELTVDPVWLARAQKLAVTLLAGDARGALALADNWIEGRDDIAPFLELAATTAMIEIGRRWEHGEISVAQEHLATALMNRVMANLYPKIMQSEPFRGRALVSCAVNELHELGSRMFADLLELDGWDVVYLGANTPVEDLVARVAQDRVRFVALSVAMPFNLQNAARAVSEIRKLDLPLCPHILLGGRAFTLDPDLWRKIGGDAYFPTAQAGVKSVRKFAVQGG